MAAHIRPRLPGVPLDPDLLAVGEPALALLRRPDADVLAQAVGGHALLPEEVVSDRALRVTEIGCVNLPGLRSATVSGTARRLRLRFRRALELPVRVEVFRGGRRVARFRRARSFTWRTRGLADGSTSRGSGSGG